jgi:hypothetical protein
MGQLLKHFFLPSTIFDDRRYSDEKVTFLLNLWLSTLYHLGNLRGRAKCEGGRPTLVNARAATL